MCRTVGAAIFNRDRPLEVLAWTRNCLALDRRYALDRNPGRYRVRARSTRLRPFESTFWGLYCYAVREAGRRDRRICGARRAPGRRGSVRTPGGGTRDPVLTGRL